MTLTPRQRRIIRTVALPAEHGGWGFLAEPILLGLLVAPSVAGGVFALATCAAFLVHQPLKLTIKDRQKGRIVERTRWAQRFVLIYGTVAVAASAIALSLASVRVLLPLILAAPLGLLQFAHDIQSQSRSITAEISGALALGSAASIIGMLGGLPLWGALALWGLLALRTVPSILYVRARLRLEREDTSQRAVAVIAQVAPLMAVGALVALGVVGPLALLGVSLLTLRALWGLSPLRRRLPASYVGFHEIGYGLVYVLLVAATAYLG